MPRITELYAYVMADTDEDDEGVPAFEGPGGVFMPMMGADMERANQLRELAQDFADSAGKPIKLIRSTAIEVVETLEPNA